MTAAGRRLLAACRGVAAVEFALIAPITLVLLMGLADLAFEAYAQAVLTGAVQKAGRDNTLQMNASQGDTLDAAVESAVRAVVPNPQFNARSVRRLSFDDYASISGEPFVDGDGDGKCDHGEMYTDLNQDGSWTAQLGQSNQGGASDVTRYTVTVTYNRLFGIASIIGWSNAVTLSATTILKNQPYLTQSAYAPASGKIGSSSPKCP